MIGNYEINVNDRGYSTNDSKLNEHTETELCNILRKAIEEGYSGPSDIYEFISEVCTR